MDVAEVERAIGIRRERWRHQCHAISLAIVKSYLFPVSRVARGACRGVMSQHSWVIVGDDCYDPDALIVDATLWSYDTTVKGIWTGTYQDDRHSPHGAGSIFEWGKPTKGDGEVIELAVPISGEAQAFLDMLGPLDRRGWGLLANAPVQDWPSKEILSAMDDTPQLRALIPIDRLGMVTDRNPDGLFLKSKPQRPTLRFPVKEDI